MESKRKIRLSYLDKFVIGQTNMIDSNQQVHVLQLNNEV